ncbi:MAG TPA: hypothetical protein VGC69_18190 [Bordetella sp.]
MAYASLGAMAALFGRFASPADRRRIVGLCGIWLTLAVLSMSAASFLGIDPTLLLLLLALSCGFFFFVVSSSGFGPPGALIFVFAVGASMSRAESWHAVFERTAATAAVVRRLHRLGDPEAGAVGLGRVVLARGPRPRRVSGIAGA